MLPLDDKRWGELQDAYGPASNIPNLLNQLSLDTSPQKDTYKEPWFSLWSALYHQGDIYTASYAAIPHLISIGHSAEGEIDPNFFFLPKEILVVIAQGRGPLIPQDIAPALFASLQHLLKIKLALKDWPVPEDENKEELRPEDKCDQCGHKANPHILIASNPADPTQGGIRICPVEGCPCFITWSFNPKQE